MVVDDLSINDFDSTKLSNLNRNFVDIETSSHVDYYKIIMSYKKRHGRKLKIASIIKTTMALAFLEPSLTASSCGWSASAADLVVLFDFLGSWQNDKSSQKKFADVVKKENLEKMLERPSYLKDRNTSAWYGLGLVVEDEGRYDLKIHFKLQHYYKYRTTSCLTCRVFWHSGGLDGSTSLLYRNNNFTWAVLLNCKLYPNDLIEFMKYAVRQVKQQLEKDYISESDDAWSDGRMMDYIAKEIPQQKPNSFVNKR